VDTPGRENAVAETALEGAEAASSPAGRPADREGDGRDHRGRRGRRRRNHGRGFPESKYASDTSSTREEPIHEGAGTEGPELAGEPEDEMAVLPGESLAKYSRMSVEPLDSGEDEEIEAAQREAEAQIPEERMAAPDAAITDTETSAAESVEADAIQVDRDEAASVEEHTASVVAESSGFPFTGAAAAVLESIEEEEPLEERHSGPSSEISVESEPENGVDSESAPEEIPATLGEPEASPGEQSGEKMDAAPSAELRANVRDQGQRFMHRMGRRPRRRGRGRNQEEGHGEPAATGTAPVEASVSARAESRPQNRDRAERPERTERPERAERTGPQSITELLKEGQEIIVQVAKEPLGQKGARITSHIALPGRYVVYMPTLDHMGVSRKVGTDEERLRLKRILQTHRVGVPGGFIVRTAGEGHTEDEIAADMNFLHNLWIDIRQKAEKRPAPLLLHHDLDIVQRTLRDQLTDNFKAIWVDNEELYESVLRFVQLFQPALVTRVKLYTRPEPIFDAFNITAELEKALRPKVWLKSGGYIVINQTEALVAIDVNTGKYVGKSNRLEDTIVKTNTEAVKEIVRQIRLRDLGGIIVVDFIDMDERKNRQKVMQVLEETMRSDRAPYKILQFNDFGLVAITRKRVKQSLERALCSPCPHCEGAGYIKSVQTVIGEILQEAQKIAPALEGKDVVLRVHPDVGKVLKSNKNQYLEEIEAIVRRAVLVKSDPLLHHEKFDLG